MQVVDDYLASLSGTEKTTISHMYDVVREMAPDAEQAMSYAMPSYRYKGKSLVAIMANKNFLSLYPFSAVNRLGVDLSDFETTSGSIHFSPERPIPDELLKEIVAARLRQIEN